MPGVCARRRSVRRVSGRLAAPVRVHPVVRQPGGNTKRDDANSRFLGSGVASARLIAEQGRAVPGTAGGTVAESVMRKVGLPLASEGQGSSQLADGVGGLGAAGSAALPLPIFGTVLGGESVIGSIAGNLPGSRHDLRAARPGRKARAYSAYAPLTESPQLSTASPSWVLARQECRLPATAQARKSRT